MRERAADGYRLLPAYRFDPRTGLWRHAAWPPRPQLTLSDISFILAARPARLDDEPTGLPPDFEALRWFPLPRACLQGLPARRAGTG